MLSKSSPALYICLAGVAHFAMLKQPAHDIDTFIELMILVR